MTLKNIISPALSCFILVVGVAIFASLQQKSPTQSDAPLVLTTLSPTETISPTATPTLSVSTVSPTPSTTSTPKPTPKPTAKPVSTACIVTINGHKYNVTSLRRTHSGGNIFVCGTDMTKTFRSQHGTDYGLIARYLIS